MYPVLAVGALEGVLAFAVGAVTDRAGVGGRARVSALATKEEEKLKEQLEEAEGRGQREAADCRV